MYQFSRLFGTARVPTENGCHIGQDEGAQHIVVLSRGQFYWFDVLDESSDLVMTERDLALNLEAVVNDAAETPIQDAAKGALGVLSTENRKVWAGLRDVLTREEGSVNAECLRTVDSALFILCLDSTEPSTAPDLCGTMLCGSSEVVRGVQIGTCTNRWYDKMQIIVCANGSAGINFEHTGVDGHTVLRFASDVYTDTILRFAKSINGQAPSLWTSTSPDPSKRHPASFGAVTTTPHKLEWDMIPELATALRFAETRLADLIQQNEFETLEFGGYGKAFVTFMGFSPDAFVQMAFQAAYYGLYGRVECTYEPAMTKAFLHGRTEAIRSVTPESVRFVQTFWGEYPAPQKIDALRQATEKHVAITRECSKALGQDRHLYALFCVWQRALDDDGAEAATAPVADENEEPKTIAAPDSPPLRSQSADAPTFARMPAIFADPGWDRLNNTILSTSNCGNPALRHFGFGPTSGDGFGIGYIIKDQSISICAASKHRQTRRFVNAIESYLLELRKLLRAAKRQQEEKDGGRVKVGAGESRAREAEEGRDRPERYKMRGRAITGLVTQTSGVSQEPEEEEEDDDGLGGCKSSYPYPFYVFVLRWIEVLTNRLDGFFDAGMLLQALRAKEQGQDGISNIDEHAGKAVAVEARRAVGKKLRLSQY